MGVVLWEVCLLRRNSLPKCSCVNWLLAQLIMRREPYKGMQPLQVIAAVVFQGKRLPQPSKTDPR
jgi:hypothetical protein